MVTGTMCEVVRDAGLRALEMGREDADVLALMAGGGVAEIKEVRVVSPRVRADGQDCCIVISYVAGLRGTIACI